MAKTERPHSINMLFIGNSFTQRNNMPGLLAELAAARNLCVKHELISMAELRYGVTGTPAELPRPSRRVATTTS